MDDHRGPLTNIRVADFGWIWAGAWIGQYLGFLGAEVIKIESRRHPDLVRRGLLIPNNELDETMNRSGAFAFANRGKRGITLSLETEGGQQLARELVKRSDVVTENFAPGTMQKYGLDYEHLSKINPGLIMASVSGYGATGPDRNYVALGPGIISHGGLTSVTGYAADRPVPLGTSYPDPSTGFIGTFAVLCALRHRALTGKGQHIDLTLLETTISSVGDEYMEFALNGRLPAPRGNRHRAMAPHGNYRCRGEDEWVSIAVGTDEEWWGLVAALGEPEWASRYDDGYRRLQCQDELDGLLTAWTKERSAEEVTAVLQEHGVPSAPCYKTDELLRHPHLRGRDMFVALDHPLNGALEQATIPVRLSRTPGAFRGPQPLIGQETDAVLQELLGLSPEEIERHRQAGALE